MKKYGNGKSDLRPDPTRSVSISAPQRNGYVGEGVRWIPTRPIFK